MRSTLLAALLTGSVLPLLTAQTTVTLPTPPPLLANTNLPFASGIGRYQQWFSLAQVQNFGGEPIRIDQLQILAGTSAALPTTLDVEIAMAHAPGFGLNGNFDSNFVTPRVVVLPRQIVNLVAAGAGNPVLIVNFLQAFTWDGQSPVLVEARIWGNGRGNQAFNHDLRATSQGLGSIVRLYQSGNASAIDGVVSQGQGLFMRFRLRPGAVTHYGSGCRGVNFITPTCDVLEIPSPGIVWTHRLHNAASQTLCGFALGDSRTAWETPTGTVPLPLDLTNVLGAPGCFLLTNPVMTVFMTTIGSPGFGTAAFQIQIPAIPDFIGLSLFTQWVVADPAAVNGVLSATDGLWSIVAPVGG
jgi:hypothetical protein